MDRLLLQLMVLVIFFVVGLRCDDHCPDFYHIHTNERGQQMYRSVRQGWLIMKLVNGDRKAVVMSDGKKTLLDALYSNRRLLNCDTSHVTDDVSQFVRRFLGDTDERRGSCMKVDEIIRRVGGREVDVVEWNGADVDLNLDQLQNECQQLHSLARLSRRRGIRRPPTDTSRVQTAVGERRVRRSSIILPGTSWCGVGNVSSETSKYGHTTGVDRCCQEHDYCNFTIEGFSTKYNLFNYRFHTLSHCECDDRFRTCLRSAAATGAPSAEFVGNLYFNVIGMRCFVFKRTQVCAERAWWGKCIRHKIQHTAELHSQLTY